MNNVVNFFFFRDNTGSYNFKMIHRNNIAMYNTKIECILLYYKENSCILYIFP